MIVVKPITITDSKFVSSNVPEPDTGEPAEYSPSTNYSPGAQVGVYTVEPNVHRLYECATANGPSTTVVEPWNDDGTYWTDLGPTNRWSMLDNGNSTQTTQADEIDLVIAPGEPFNAFGLINVNGSEAQVIITDPTDGEVFNQTYSLVSDSGISDWYAYFFTPIEYINDLADLSLPSYPNAEIRVIVRNTGSTAAVGSFVVGFQKDIGITDYGTGIGIKDYSRKETNAFGDFSILQRAFSKRADYAVTVRTERVAYVQSYLSSIRSVPALYVGNEDYASTILFGYYRDFQIILGSFQISECRLSVEGLTR